MAGSIPYMNNRIWIGCGRPFQGLPADRLKTRSWLYKSSLGHLDDFDLPWFNGMLAQSIGWACEKAPGKAANTPRP